MEDKKEYLTYLLLKNQWTEIEKRWMQNYLDDGAIETLYEIAQEQYHDDLLVVEDIIEQQLSRKLLNKIHERIKVRRSWRISPVFIAAATIAAIITLGISVWLFQSGTSGNFSSGKARLKEVSTGAGERTELKLPDGSKVWLSPASRLRFPDEFSGSTREVFLTGEAFFEVARNPSRPFLIRSGLIETKVLGTAFNVKAYEKFDKVAVTVVHGKVAVYTSEKQDISKRKEFLEIVSDQRAVFNKKRKAFSVEEDPSASLLLARREGMLVYKGSTLTSVVEDLSIQYGKDIIVRGAIAHCSYYGEFSMTDSLEDSLRQIYLTLGAILSKEGDVFVITGDNC